MTSVFGVDLTSVKLHVDDSASRAATAMGVEAYSVGNHISFAPGRFDPASRHGRHVLAHEVAHTLASPALHGVHAFEGPEHRDAGDQGPRDLVRFLGTPEGAAWAQQLGYDPALLLADLGGDPFVQQPDRRMIVGAGRQAHQEGQRLTPGEAISLSGDIFEPERIGKAPTKTIRDVLEIFDRQKAGLLHGAEADVAIEKATGGDYSERAKDNLPHFASLGPTVEGMRPTLRDNRSEWQRLHQLALAKAREASQATAARERTNTLDEAYLLDAAGGHFLTDAFSAGHLIDPIRIEAAATIYLRVHPLDNRANPEADPIALGLDQAGLLVKLVLKNLHDRLNREGFMVRNGKGLRWKAFGDGHLEATSESMKVMSLAVLLSRRQVAHAYDGSLREDESAAEQILDLLPDRDTIQRATDDAISKMPDAVSDVMPLINRSVGMVGAGNKKVLRALQPYLDTVTSPDRSKQLEQAKDRGGIAPQLTWRF